MCNRMCGMRKASATDHMASNLNLDQNLLDEALKIGGKKTKRETVNEALAEYIQRRKQKKILRLFGQVDLDPKYDYKTIRKKR